MVDIKKETIAKYVRHLTNFGCQFKIIEADGAEHGDLTVVKPSARNKRVLVLSEVDYKTPLMSMKAGDVIGVDCPSHVPIESLRSSIAGFSTTHFGPGVVTTTLDRENSSVIVLRVE